MKNGSLINVSVFDDQGKYTLDIGDKEVEVEPVWKGETLWLERTGRVTKIPPLKERELRPSGRGMRVYA